MYRDSLNGKNETASVSLYYMHFLLIIMATYSYPNIDLTLILPNNDITIQLHWHTIRYNGKQVFSYNSHR